MQPGAPNGGGPEMSEPRRAFAREVAIEAAPGVVLWGDLLLPRGRSPRGVVLIPDGRHSSRAIPRGGRAAQVFSDAGIATLQLGLLTAVEEGYLANMFDVELLAQRLLSAAGWLARQAGTASLAQGYFGANGTAAVVLHAAAESHASVCAVLSPGDPPAAASECTHDGLPHVLLIAARPPEEVAGVAARWFGEHLGDGAVPPSRRRHRRAAPAEVLLLSPR